MATHDRWADPVKPLHIPRGTEWINPRGAPYRPARGPRLQWALLRGIVGTFGTVYLAWLLLGVAVTFFGFYTSPGMRDCHSKDVQMLREFERANRDGTFHACHNEHLRSGCAEALGNGARSFWLHALRSTLVQHLTQTSKTIRHFTRWPGRVCGSYCGYYVRRWVDVLCSTALIAVPVLVGLGLFQLLVARKGPIEAWNDARAALAHPPARAFVAHDTRR